MNHPRAFSGPGSLQSYPSNNNNPPSNPPGGLPTQPQPPRQPNQLTPQQLQAKQAQASHFLKMVTEFMNRRGTPLPRWFTHGEGVEGGVPGTFGIGKGVGEDGGSGGGRRIEVWKLWAGIGQMGGLKEALKHPQFPKILGLLHLPPTLPESTPFVKLAHEPQFANRPPTTNSLEVIVAAYSSICYPLEDFRAKQIAQTKMQQQQQQQMQQNQQNQQQLLQQQMNAPNSGGHPSNGQNPSLPTGGSNVHQTYHQHHQQIQQQQFQQQLLQQQMNAPNSGGHPSNGQNPSLGQTPSLPTVKLEESNIPIQPRSQTPSQQRSQTPSQPSLFPQQDGARLEDAWKQAVEDQRRQPQQFFPARQPPQQYPQPRPQSQQGPPPPSFGLVMPSTYQPPKASPPPPSPSTSTTSEGLNRASVPQNGPTHSLVGSNNRARSTFENQLNGGQPQGHGQGAGGIGMPMGEGGPMRPPVWPVSPVMVAATGESGKVGGEVGLDNGSSLGQKRKAEDSLVQSAHPPPPPSISPSSAIAPPDPSPTIPKLAPPTPAPVASTSAPSPRVRSKVTYVPLCREPHTYGGWDLDAIERERAAVLSTRQPCSLGELGRVDIDGLAMSLRSRIASEISYALTAVHMLSSQPAPQEAEQRFEGMLPIMYCSELFEELVDLLEEVVFGEGGLKAEIERLDQPLVERKKTPGERPTLSHSLLIFHAKEVSTHPARLPRLPSPSESFGSSTLSSSRRAQIALAILNILGDLASQKENVQMMVASARLLRVLVYMCDPLLAGLEFESSTGSLRVVSELKPVFTPVELIRVRKDVLDMFANLGMGIRLYLPGLTEPFVERWLDLITSFIYNPTDDVVAHPDAPPSTPKPIDQFPHLLHTAIDSFSQVAFQDLNRVVLGKLPSATLLRLYAGLITQLPITIEDFHRFGSHPGWFQIVAQSCHSLYSLVFLASAELKAELRKHVGWSALVVRLMSRLIAVAPDFAINPFGFVVGRLGELMVLLSDRKTIAGGEPRLSFGLAPTEPDGRSEEHVELEDKDSWMIGEERLTELLVQVKNCDPRWFGDLDALVNVY